MTPAQAESTYARLLQRPVVIRRFTGAAGPARTPTDTPAKGHVKGVSAEALIGDNMQTLGRAIVGVDELVAGGFAVPITTGDKLVVDGRELAISLVDNWTHYVAGALRAYRLTLKG